MGNLLSNTIYNYNQVYDTLRTVKLNDYLLDKRDNVHNSLFNAALNKLMLSVNFVLRYLYNKVIVGEYNPNDLKSNLPFLVCDSVIKICEVISVEDIHNSGKIKEIIIGRRKQELLLNLQRDILNDALNNNKLKIIEENDKVTE